MTSHQLLKTPTAHPLLVMEAPTHLPQLTLLPQKEGRTEPGLLTQEGSWHKCPGVAVSLHCEEPSRSRGQSSASGLG